MTKLTFNNQVRTESRYGTNLVLLLPDDWSARAEMTRPSVVKDLIQPLTCTVCTSVQPFLQLPPNLPTTSYSVRAGNGWASRCSEPQSRRYTHYIHPDGRCR